MSRLIRLVPLIALVALIACGDAGTDPLSVQESADLLATPSLAASAAPSMAPARDPGAPWYRVVHPRQYAEVGVRLPSRAELMRNRTMVTTLESECDPETAIIECPEDPVPGVGPSYAYGSSITYHGWVNDVKQATMYTFSEAISKISSTSLHARFGRRWDACQTPVQLFHEDYQIGAGSPLLLESSLLFEWIGQAFLLVDGFHRFHGTNGGDFERESHDELCG